MSRHRMSAQSPVQHVTNLNSDPSPLELHRLESMDAHEAGCFSWFQRRKTRKVKRDVEKPTPPVTDTTNFTGQTESIKDFTPSGKEYAIEATKRTIDILSGVVGLVGVPLVKEILDIGLSIISTCETINEVQERVAELKNRVASFLLVIAKIAKDPNDNPMLKTSQNLMDELQDLKLCLTSITTRLEAIGNQNVVLTTLLPDANMKTIDECVSCFQDGIDRFQTLRGIHAAQDLTNIQNQLEEIYGLTKVVAQKVEHIEFEVREMKSSVDELKAMLESAGSETDHFAVSTRMPPAPGFLLGRDAVVDRIATELSSGNTKRACVCVLGPGGMGKTSTALAVVEHPAVKAKFTTRNRIWVPCISLTSPSALLAFLARCLGVASQSDPLQAVVSTLEQQTNPTIILLDNFETPWHPVEGDQSLTRNILQALDTLSNVSIMVTMRSEFPPLPHWQAERLDILSLEDSRRVYTAIRQREEKTEELNPLLEAIGRLPYAVTLLATQAKYASASPSQMLSEWQVIGSEMLTDVEDTSKSMDNSIELSVKSKYVTQSAGATELLQVLSMLPGGVYQDDLSIWMKSWRLSALSILRNAALVISRELTVEGVARMHLLVLPVVQSYMQQHGRISEPIRRSTHKACIDFLCARKSMIEGPNNPQYKNDLPDITAQEANLQAILTDILQELKCNTPSSSTSEQLPAASSEQLDALLTFAFYQTHTRPRLDMAEQVLTLVKRSNSPLHEAHANSCLAVQQASLWFDSLAISGYTRARELYLTLGEPIEACHADIGILFCSHEAEDETSHTSHLLSLAAEMQKRWEPFFSSHPAIHGLVLSWTAHLSWLLCPHNQPGNVTIVEDMQKAQEIFATAHLPEDLRDSQLVLMRYYLKASQHDKALLLADQALELIVKERLPEDSFFQLCKARCMKTKGEWGQELHTTLQEGLASAQKIGLPYEIALLLEEFAEVYVRNEDWPAARLAFEGILKECGKGTGQSLADVSGRVRKNLAFINDKEAGTMDSPTRYRPPLRW